MNAPRFSAPSLLELRERVGYEDWLLESVYKLAAAELFPTYPDATIYRLDAAAPITTRMGSMNIVIGDWRPRFLEAGAPLVFTATFKVLDMLFERILEENGLEPNLQFARKLEQLRDPKLDFPSFLSSRGWLVERLKALYLEGASLRGTIIHSRHFESAGGTLRVAPSRSKSARIALELDEGDLRAFARLVVGTLRFIEGEWTPSGHQDKLLRWQADRLVKLHKTASFGQLQPFHTTVRFYTRDPRFASIDLDRIRSDLANENRGQDVTFDLRVVVVDSETPVAAYLIPHEAMDRLADIEDPAAFNCDIPSN